jgi:hypothetical protein
MAQGEVALQEPVLQDREAVAALAVFLGGAVGDPLPGLDGLVPLWRRRKETHGHLTPCAPYGGRISLATLGGEL